MPVLPLTELKAHLNISSATHDAELTTILDAAEAWTGKYLGTRLGQGTRTFTLRAAGRVLFLPRFGLLGVSSVARYDGSTVPAFGVGAEHGFSVDVPAGVVYLPEWSPYPWSVTATYDPVVPADVRLAVLIIAAHLWETQRGQSPSPLSVQDDLQFAAQLDGSGYAIPNRARALLDPYRIAAVA